MTPEKPWKKSKPINLLEHALALAEGGIPVFPCMPGSKRPLTPHGFKDATTDPVKIRQYWLQYPKALIGMPTGEITDCFIADLDRKPGQADGVLEWPKLFAKYNAALPDTLITETPSGGQHWRFKYVQGMRNVPLGKLWPGIEIKGEGGYVIVAPSPGYRKISNGALPAEADPWLQNLILNAQSASPTAAKPKEIEELVADDTRLVPLALAVIPNDNESFDFYNEIGLLCYNASHGSDEGFKAFDEWAKKSSKYHKGLRADWPDRRWSHYKRSPFTRAGAGKLFFLAQEQDPNWRDALPIDIEVNIDALVKKTKESWWEQSQARKDKQQEFPKHLLHVPGLVGKIAQFITDSAMYPQPLLSLATALTLVGTAAGRYYLGPTKSGTHLYMICLAETGVGKDHARNAAIDILVASGLGAHVGPDQFMSMPSVINLLKREPLVLCAQDEFGSYLKRLNNRRANSFEASLMAALQKAWGISNSSMTTPEWANVPSSIIFAPALSLLGFSTPEQFFEALQSKDVANGFLNRCLVLEILQRVAQRVPLLDRGCIPDSITSQMNDIYSRRGGAFSKLSTTKSQFETLGITPAAEAARIALVRELEQETDKLKESLMVRIPEIAIRLATIVTIGQGLVTIEEDTMQWAIDFARWFGLRFVKLARENIADSENQVMAQEIMRIIRAKGNGKQPPWIKQADIARALKHKYKRRDLDDVFKGFYDSEELEGRTTKPDLGGRITRWWRLNSSNS